MIVFSRRFYPSDGLQHQCDISALCSAAIGSAVPYWVRECTRKLPPPYTSALSLPPILYSSLSLPPTLSQSQIPLLHLIRLHGTLPPRVEHQLWWWWRIPFSSPSAPNWPPVEERRRSSARVTASVDEQRARASNGGAVRAAAQPPAATVVPQFHRGTSCISFLLVPRCCITCCLCLYSIWFHDRVLIWSSIGWNHILRREQGWRFLPVRLGSSWKCIRLYKVRVWFDELLYALASCKSVWSIYPSCAQGIFHPMAFA